MALLASLAIISGTVTTQLILSNAQKTFSKLILFMLGQGSSVFYLGTGLGGMERFITYPYYLWMLGFGGYLIGEASNSNSEVRK